MEKRLCRGLFFLLYLFPVISLTEPAGNTVSLFCFSKIRGRALRVNGRGRRMDADFTLRTEVCS